MRSVNVTATTRCRAAEHAVAIYAAAVAAVHAGQAVLRAIESAPIIPEPGPGGKILVVGAGKAAWAMVDALERHLGSRIHAGVAVTKHGHSQATRVVRMLEAGHPMPNEGSVVAGRAVHDLVSAATEHDVVVVALSGGASALLELPANGLSLADLRATSDLLLRAGAPIEELNAVRSCLSQLKAGGLARAAAPARVVVLALSDVLGNPLDVIGSGPCVDAEMRPDRARAVLEARDLWNVVPEAVRERIAHLERTAGHRPMAAGEPVAAGRATRPARVTHHIVGDIWSALRAAEECARERGLRPLVLTGWLQGEAREVGKLLGGVARDLPKNAAAHGVDCLLLGGETTVTVRGEGAGGRCQELATAAATMMASTPSVGLLAAGTDGTDGITNAAGGLVDGETFGLAAARDQDAERSLRENDTYHYLAAAEGLVLTGPTHSNVGDLVVLVADEEESA